MKTQRQKKADTPAGSLPKALFGSLKILVTTLASLFVAAVLFDPFPELFAPVIFLFRLLFGWAFYVIETVPQIHLDAMLLINGLVGLGVAAVALHLVARWWRREHSEEKPAWRWQATLGLTLFVAILFASQVCAMGLVEHGSRLITEPMWTRSRLSEEKTAILLRRQSAYQSFSLLAEGERFIRHLPKHIFAAANLTGEYKLTWQHATRHLHEARGEPREIWFLLEPPGGIVQDRLPVLYAPRTESTGLRIVAFGDGEVKELTEPEWEEALTRWRVALAEKPPGKDSTP